ncbi:649_t:CDS:1 [Funneliformis geosporum]|uniref:7485_t:CDS:1 n=1 Tax=Funneliformis geosporum TaxID=1117311 RepID=A0A9W4SWB8_9GLOM|nr:7485_t:CDS:1 [Funneliformis geosporum]CAI2187028.1 649_t:CDS:1 [Funneliformis geosporum]
MSTIADQVCQSNLPDLPSQHPEPLIEGIPTLYIVAKLHEMGSSYFQDKFSAFAELRIEGIDKSFWIHREYLELQSSFFKKVLEQVGQGDMILISLPSPATFEPILEYLYTGNDDKLYDLLNLDNYYDFWQNVVCLGLGSDIRNIILSFSQNEVDI